MLGSLKNLVKKLPLINAVVKERDMLMSQLSAAQREIRRLTPVSTTTRKHIVISGTGRSGTSFLVELLTHLGLETGYTPQQLDAERDPIAKAGFEVDIRQSGCPYVVKSPWFCDYADEVFSRPDIVVEHLFVPMRDIVAAAQSRRDVNRQNLKKASLWTRFRSLWSTPNFNGGLQYTNSGQKGKHEDVLQNQLYNLLLAAARTQVPVTLMQYPRIVKDPQFLYSKLAPVLNGVEYEAFAQVFNKVARPTWVHTYTNNDKA